VYRALIVCNSRFDDAGSLAELDGPNQNGILLRDTLTDRDTGRFEDAQLLDEKGAVEVERAISEFFAAGGEYDALLFYYSGYVLVQNQQPFLCAKDTSAERLHSTAISGSKLNDIMSDSSAAVIIIVLDICYSDMFKDDIITNTLCGDDRMLWRQLQ
jgi:Caspase domain